MIDSTLRESSPLALSSSPTFFYIERAIKVFSKQADTLKNEFKGVLSSRTELVNTLSLAYVFMVYYNFYKEVAGIKASKQRIIRNGHK